MLSFLLWNAFRVALILIACIAVSVIIDRVNLTGESIRLQISYNHQLALKQELYPVCSQLDDLYGKVPNYRRKLKHIHDLQLKHEIWCGMERESLLSRKRMPWTGCESQIDESKLELLEVIRNLCDNQKYANEVYARKATIRSNMSRAYKTPRLSRLCKSCLRRESLQEEESYKGGDPCSSRKEP